jgi:lysophospholipase L1-like esterase
MAGSNNWTCACWQQAVLPRSNRTLRRWQSAPHHELWKELNGWYKQIAASDPSRLGFVDCGWTVTTDDGQELPVDLMPDGVHPSDKGYHRMYPCVLAAAKRLLEGEKVVTCTAQ